MIWIYVIAATMAIGLAVGYAAEHVPLVPVLQSIGAVFTAMVFDALFAAILWNLNPPETGGVAAVSFGFDIGRLLMFGGTVCAVTATLHVVLGRLSGIALGC